MPTLRYGQTNITVTTDETEARRLLAQPQWTEVEPTAAEPKSHEEPEPVHDDEAPLDLDS